MTPAVRSRSTARGAATVCDDSRYLPFAGATRGMITPAATQSPSLHAHDTVRW
jgi:hypothetical protein